MSAGTLYDVLLAVETHADSAPDLRAVIRGERVALHATMQRAERRTVTTRAINREARRDGQSIQSLATIAAHQHAHNAEDAHAGSPDVGAVADEARRVLRLWLDYMPDALRERVARTAGA